MYIQKKHALIALSALLVAGAVVMTGMMGGPGGGRGPMGEEEEAVHYTVVETQSPVMGSIVVTTDFVGTVEPGQQVTVYPKAAGEVTAANYSVGDTVEAGAVLFQIDSTSLQLNIAQSQATLANSQARANLNLEIAQRDAETYQNNVSDGLNAKLLTAESQVQNAENALQSANTKLRTARREYNDAKSGDSDTEYTDSQIDSLRDAKVQAELSVESAQLSLEQAKANLEVVKQEVAENAISVEDNVALMEISANMSDQYIALQKLQNDLGDYTVTAPITGIVEQRNIDPFDMASTQQAAYVISNKEAMTLTFQVTEGNLAYMRPGDLITVEKSGETCTGVITEVGTMVDSATGLYPVKASVDNPPFEMHSGSIVKLKADTQKVENEMMVPIDAIYYDNGSPFVYTMVGNTAVKTAVTTGISDDQNIQILSGLSYQDAVIITWSSSLMDGAEVYLPGETPEEQPENGEDAEGEPAEGPADRDDGPGAQPGDTDSLENTAAVVDDGEDDQVTADPDGSDQGDPDNDGENLPSDAEGDNA